MNQITFELGKPQTFRGNDECNNFEVTIKLVSISNEEFSFRIRRHGEKETIHIQRDETVLILGNHYVVSGYGSDYVRFSLKYMDDSKIFSKLRGGQKKY